MTLGTNWVGPSKGATVLELCAAHDDGLEADGNLASTRTSLALTGQPIQDYDCRRIVAALIETICAAVEARRSKERQGV